MFRMAFKTWRQHLNARLHIEDREVFDRKRDFVADPHGTVCRSGRAFLPRPLDEALAIMACEIGAEGARRKLAPVVDHFVFNESGKMISVRGFYNFGCHARQNKLFPG